MKNRIHILMVALEALLSSVTSPLFEAFARSAAASATKIEDLQNQLMTVGESMRVIQARADGENRQLSTEEATQLDNFLAQFLEIEEDITRRKSIDDANARLNTGAGRQTDPNNPGANTEPGANPPGRARAGAGANAADRNAGRPHYGTAGRTSPAAAADLGKMGFRSFGEFAQMVKASATPGNQNLDPRLVMNSVSTAGNEGTGADGGFAIPPDFRTEIMEKVNGEESLLARTDQLTSSSNSITIPKDETTPWQGTGGVQAYWENELQQITTSKPALEQTTIRLFKLTALVPVSDELLEDAPAMSTYLRRKAPMKIDFRVTDSIVNGTGVGQPLGILNAGAKIAVAAEAAQSSATIVFNNIVKMYSRLYSGCRSGAIWLINQDIEPQLLGMQFPGTGTAVPVYLPPGGLSGAPYGSLMGKPVIPTEACQTLGTEGDIILTDLSTYMTAMKTGGMRQDVSIHLYFDYNATAFRFILRIAGQPWWTTSITPKNGSNTRSCIVSLATRP